MEETAAGGSGWKIASLYLTHKNPETQEVRAPVFEVLADHALIKFNYLLPTTPAATCQVTYRVYADDTIRRNLITSQYLVWAICPNSA
jgi:beta-galactosidase